MAEHHERHVGQSARIGKLHFAGEDFGESDAFGVVAKLGTALGYLFGGEELLDALVEVGVEGVYQHEAGDLGGVGDGVKLHVDAAERSAHQHVGGLDASR